MSRRLKITLPDPICARLDEMAANSGEPVSRLAAQIVLSRVMYGPGEQYPMTATVDQTSSQQRPCWLEPPGENAEWRSQMWDEIVALWSRYPRELADLNDHWWESESLVETLCALATWRRGIDESGRDPREELAFQAGLSECSNSLKGEVTRRMRPWNPGPPPEHWRAASAPDDERRCLDDGRTLTQCTTHRMAYLACSIDRMMTGAMAI